MPESDALRCHSNYGFVVADNSISSYYPGHNIFKYKVVLGFYIQSVCLGGTWETCRGAWPVQPKELHNALKHGKCDWCMCPKFDLAVEQNGVVCGSRYIVCHNRRDNEPQNVFTWCDDCYWLVKRSPSVEGVQRNPEICWSPSTCIAEFTTFLTNNNIRYNTCTVHVSNLKT